MIAEGLLCLALNIFHESRSEPIEAQIAVAAVTVNRAKESESNSICEAVYEPSAFSWTQSRTLKRIKNKSQLKDEQERKAFELSEKIAKLYLQGKLKNPIGSRIYFNHRRLGKRWNTPNKPIVLSKLMYY